MADDPAAVDFAQRLAPGHGRDRAVQARRLVPAVITLRRARRRAARAWERDPALRAAARLRMAAIVTGTAREPELEALARRGVLEEAAWAELLLRPWLLTDRRRVHDADHLVSARATGRGVLVSYCHLGPFQGASSALRGHGSRPWHFAGPWLVTVPPPGPAGHHLRRWQALTVRTGCRVLIAERGALARGTDLLRGGELVGSLFDVPGGTRTSWLGKPVDLASGSARMACAADALVVPLHSWRRRGRAHSAFLPALDPRDHDNPEALHRALAAVHERLILERPEALEDPRRTGSWEERATPTAWSRTPELRTG